MGPNEMGFVDAGNLVAVVAGVPELYRNDVLDSTLLGQLAATKRYSRFDQREEWGKKYRDTIESVGWRIDRFRVNPPYQPAGREFRVETIVLEVLERLATAAELSLVESTIAALETLPGTDPAVEVFEPSSHSLHRVNLEVCAVSEGTNGPRMKVANIAFTIDEDIERIFRQDFTSILLDGDQVETTSYTAVLDERVYAPLRREILDKLGSKREEYIWSLDVATNSLEGVANAP